MTRAFAGALIAAVILLITIFWEARDAIGLPDGNSPRQSSAQVQMRVTSRPDTNDFVDAWVATTLERPLLNQNRRPRKTLDEALSNTDEPVRLLGVMTGPFGNRAIFLSAGATKQIVLREGMRGDDFVVRVIEPGHAVVESGGTLRTLKVSLTNAE